ncbi:MAG: glycosyl transferase, partial [Microvirga sp.]|nr:glycosyl transferase [Microvirga sp.]
GEFQAENERLSHKPVLSTRVQGFNINSGKRVDIAAYATGF